jgi:hypothetical protein
LGDRGAIRADEVDLGVDVGMGAVAAPDGFQH